MKLGDPITVNQIYKRCTRSRPSKHGAWSVTVKIWEAMPIKPREAIYLGKRTLWNGTRTWEDEVGNIFEPEDHFTAMLVCFSTHENPVYVPMKEDTA
jgi:hypothetical protein